MSERQIRERTKELSDWYGTRSLTELRDEVNALIEEYGDQAEIYMRGDYFEVQVEWKSPETDEEYAKRLFDEETQRNWKALIASASEKLTPEEKAAVTRYRFSNPF